MTKDAKLGLVLGIGLVIVITVVFFRKEPSQAKAGTETKTAAVVQSKGIQPAARPAAGKQHIVAEGDTLFGIALRYYNDGTKFVRIYQANQNVLVTPDRLQPGTVLAIPDEM